MFIYTTQWLLSFYCACAFILKSWNQSCDIDDRHLTTPQTICGSWWISIFAISQFEPAASTKELRRLTLLLRRKRLWNNAERIILFEMGVTHDRNAFRCQCGGEVSPLHLYKLHPRLHEKPAFHYCRGNGNTWCFNGLTVLQPMQIQWLTVMTSSKKKRKEDMDDNKLTLSNAN